MPDGYAVVIERTGSPDVIEVRPIAVCSPGAGEVLVRHEAVGLNFIDTYYRSGLYQVPLPSGLGSEAAGVVEAVGDGAGDFKPGDRVGYFTGPIGAYATHRTVSAERLVRVPDGIGAETAAAAMLKGCTAEYLIERCARIRAGQTVLVHAAAGGVGSILVQWLKAIGATAIAHTGSEAKARAAASLGADHALSCPLAELGGKVREISGGDGAEVVLDGVGAVSWEASLASVARRGLVVSYGNASGPVPPFSALELTRAGSIFVTRPTLADYASSREEMQRSAGRLFEMVGDGSIGIRIGAHFSLRDAAQAHRALEARATIGATVLLP